MNYYGKLTGKTYDSLEAMRHYEGMEARRRNVPTDEQAAFDNLPADKIREHFNRLAADDQTRAAQEQMVVDAEVFKQLHPEYKATKNNLAAMTLALRSIGADVDHDIATLGQFERALELCKANGSVELDGKALQKQKQAGIEQRASAIRQERDFDPLEAEGLSLDELRRRASAQLAGVEWTTDERGAEYTEGARPLAGPSSRLDDPQRILHPGSQFNRRGFGAASRS